MDDDVVIYDANDVSVGIGDVRWTHLVVGDFEIQLGPDGGALWADDAALVIPLDQS